MAILIIAMVIGNHHHRPHHWQDIEVSAPCAIQHTWPRTLCNVTLKRMFLVISVIISAAPTPSAKYWRFCIIAITVTIELTFIFTVHYFKMNNIFRPVVSSIFNLFISFSYGWPQGFSIIFDYFQMGGLKTWENLNCDDAHNFICEYLWWVSRTF